MDANDTDSARKIKGAVDVLVVMGAVGHGNLCRRLAHMESRRKNKQIVIAGWCKGNMLAP